MISRKYRFAGHSSLNYIYRNGKTVRGSVMMARFAPNKNRELPRFSVVVGRKVYKSAAKRNRIRRRIYEAIRLHIKPDSPSIDIAISVYSPDIIDMPDAKLKKQVTDLLAATGFLS